MQTNSFLETLTLQSENIRFRKLKVSITEFPLLLTDIDLSSLSFTLQLSTLFFQISLFYKNYAYHLTASAALLQEEIPR